MYVCVCICVCTRLVFLSSVVVVALDSVFNSLSHELLASSGYKTKQNIAFGKRIAEVFLFVCSGFSVLLCCWKKLKMKCKIYGCITKYFLMNLFYKRFFVGQNSYILLRLIQFHRLYFACCKLSHWSRPFRFDSVLFTNFGGWFVW